MNRLEHGLLRACGSVDRDVDNQSLLRSAEAEVAMSVENFATFLGELTGLDRETRTKSIERVASRVAAILNTESENR